jgi:hypothetical protein
MDDAKAGLRPKDCESQNMPYYLTDGNPRPLQQANFCHFQDMASSSTLTNVS